MRAQFEVDWIDCGEPSRLPPHPAFPDGIKLDISEGRSPNCTIALPSPADGSGWWVICCQLCAWEVQIRTCGRADDPRSIKLACHARRGIKAG